MNHGKGNTAWPDGNVAVLRRLWAEGLSASQIAKQMNKLLQAGLTRNAVIAKCHRLGLTKRTPSRPMTKRQRPTIPRARRETKPPTERIERLRERGAKASPANVRHKDRAWNQCPRFVADQSGADGFVCGSAVPLGDSWCPECKRAIFVPAKQARAA